MVVAGEARRPARPRRHRPPRVSPVVVQDERDRPRPGPRSSAEQPRAATASALSTPARSTSRWVTARIRPGPICGHLDAALGKRAATTPAGSSTSKITMLVSTVAGSIVAPGIAARPSASTPRVRVVLRQPLDVVVERVEARRGHDAGLAHRAAHHLLEAPRLVDQLRASRRGTAPTGAPRPFVKSSQAVVEARPRSRRRARPTATTAFISRAPSRWVAQPVAARATSSTSLDLLERPDPAAAVVGRLLDAHEPRARRVAVAGACAAAPRPARR